MVAEMLQKSKFLYALYLCYIKFYFGYIFDIYVICYYIFVLYLYVHYVFFNFVIYFYFHII